MEGRLILGIGATNRDAGTEDHAAWPGLDVPRENGHDPLVGRAPQASPRLITFPRLDGEFAALAAESVRVAMTPEALSEDLETAAVDAIRCRYSNAMIKVRSVEAGFGDDPVWYVFRDGRILADEP